MNIINIAILKSCKQLFSFVLHLVLVLGSRFYTACNFVSLQEAYSSENKSKLSISGTIIAFEWEE